MILSVWLNFKFNLKLSEFNDIFLEKFENYEILFYVGGQTRPCNTKFDTSTGVDIKARPHARGM